MTHFYSDSKTHAHYTPCCSVSPFLAYRNLHARENKLHRTHDGIGSEPKFQFWSTLQILYPLSLARGPLSLSFVSKKCFLFFPCSTLQPSSFPPEVITYDQWAQLKPEQKSMFSGWIKGAFRGGKNEMQESIQQKLHFILSTAPIWDRYADIYALRYFCFLSLYLNRQSCRYFIIFCNKN